MEIYEALLMLRGGATGVERWNYRRAEMWEDIPSLTDAQLSRANLKEAILVDIDLLSLIHISEPTRPY